MDIQILYRRLPAPIAAMNFREQRTPYNEVGISCCCDARHDAPTATRAEWGYLQASTDLWRLWRVEDLTRLGCNKVVAAPSFPEEMEITIHGA